MSSIVDLYLNQTVTLKRTVGFNAYGEPKEPDLTTIRVNWEDKYRLIKDKNGREVVSEAKVLCLEFVKVGDVLVDASGREWPVAAVHPIKDLTGAVQYYEVYL